MSKLKQPEYQVLTRTVYGSYLNICLLTGKPFKVIPNTTLNEVLGINVDLSLALPSGTIPTLKYLCIGNGGHKTHLNSHGILTMIPVPHTSDNAAPFNIIPFVLREADDDLPQGVREQYALRREEEHDGVNYIAYYLKRIDMQASNVEMSLVTIEDDGTKSTIPFIPNSSNLNPKPQDIPPTGVNVLEGKYISAYTDLQVHFTPEDCEELRHVASVLYNDEYAAVVSEIGLVSGVDQKVNVGGVGTSLLTVNEVVAAQMTNVLSTFRSCSIDNLGWDVLFRIGSNLPLWQTENINTP